MAWILLLEKVGVGNGGLRERLTEAGQLVARGRAQEGLDLASKAVSESAPGDQLLLSAAEALRTAAEVAVRNQGLSSPEVLERIAEKLRLMASGDKSAEELGRAVDDLTGSLGQAGANGGPDASGGPAEAGQGNQDGAPAGTDGGSGEGQQDSGSDDGGSGGGTGTSQGPNTGGEQSH